jgi:hypothetical protein
MSSNSLSASTPAVANRSPPTRRPRRSRIGCGSYSRLRRGHSALRGVGSILGSIAYCNRAYRHERHKAGNRITTRPARRAYAEARLVGARVAWAVHPRAS